MSLSLPANKEVLSPMMRQYAAVKEQHQDALLFYRLGDFYELFFDDAVTASRELELVLTGRDCGLSERAPMCGIPFHSCDGYIARLVAKGYKVAICEQVEDPAAAKGIVRREVIRVVTPGTVTDSNMLTDGQNNYICCAYLEKDGFGLCFADVSTGSVYVTEAAGRINVVMDELARFEPKEILLNGAAADAKALADFIKRNLGVVPERLYDRYFDADVAKANIIRQFDDERLMPIFALTKGYGVLALGALLQYVSETQFHGANRLVDVETYRCAEFLSMSASTRRNLELTGTMRSGEKRGSLLWVVDRTLSPMGKRCLRSMLEKPLMDTEAINARLEAVDAFYNDTVLATKVRDALGGVFDLERIMTRVLYRSVTPRDMRSFYATCEKLEDLTEIAQSFDAPLLCALRGALDPLSDIKTRIDETIAEQPPALLKDGGYIRYGFNQQVDELRELVTNSKTYLARMETKLKEETGIKNLRIGYNRVFGYYIEVSKSNTDSVPANFIRKQTLANGERYINEELKELEAKILNASNSLNILEREIYEDLVVFIEAQLKRVQGTTASVAMIDALSALATLARDNGYVRPVVDESGVLDIRNGRHPVVEKVINNGELFVPNDTLLDGCENLVSLITGPNMAGKSTYMRQTALIVLLAQMGSFVPAASAHIGVVDAIFTRVGASDDLFAGDSTFMVEMKEVAEILGNATDRSLVILDEIGRGTSTYDGMSIARAVVEAICDSDGIGAKTMFATHYHELTEMVNDFANIQNYNIAVKKRGDEITFLRRIVKGPADDSYGIEVAKLAGIPDKTIERAKEVLDSLVSGSAEMPVAPKRAQQTETPATAQKVIARLDEVQIERLTPIEAMYVLNELKQIAQQNEEETCPS